MQVPPPVSLSKQMRIHLTAVAFMGIAMTAVAVSPFHSVKNKGEVKDGFSLLAKDSKNQNRVKEKDPLDDLKDEQVFVRVGQDSLTWKAVREQAELVINRGIQFPEGASAEDREAMRRYSLKRSVSGLMRRYLKNALVAQVAKTNGFLVSEAEYNSAISNLTANFERKGEDGKKQADLIRSRDSLMAHNAANALLVDKYRKDRIAPQVTASADEVAELMLKRHDRNRVVAATNALLGVQIRDIRRKIVKGDLEFAKAAEEYSECGSSQQGGLLGDLEFNGGVRPEWEIALRKMKPGEISGIVETPFSYHILKLENFIFSDDDKVKDGTTATGARISHILLEKEYLRPELTHAQAVEIVKNIKISKYIEKLWVTMINEQTVYCAIPLLSGSIATRARKAEETLRKEGGK